MIPVVGAEGEYDFGVRVFDHEIQEAVVTVGLDRKIRSWSRSAERVFGWTSDEACGQDVFALISPQSTAEASALFIDRLLQNGHLSGDTLFVRKDGSQLETRSTFVLIRDAAGVPREILGIARDVGDLRRERARQLDDARLRGLAERMNESELVVGLDGQIIEANERAAQLYGFSRAELLTMNVRDVRAPEALADLPEQLRSATDGPTRFQTTHRRKDGSTFPVEVSSRPFDIGGRKYLHSLLRDMTGQIQRETRLRDQAEQLERAAAQLNFVLEGANDGFWDWHIESGRVQYNPRWAEMLGYEQHELTDGIKAWERLLHVDDRPAVEAALTAHLRGESTHYQSEHRLRHKDGRWVWVLDRGKVVEWGDDGRPVRAAGTHTDITQRRIAAAALEASLEENQRLVGELREALANVKVLSGLLPICMHCKKIRDDKGYWERIDKYIAAHTDAAFSHGLCPDCIEQHYPEFDLRS